MPADNPLKPLGARKGSEYFFHGRLSLEVGVTIPQKPYPLTSFNEKENHIGRSVSEILIHHVTIYIG